MDCLEHTESLSSTQQRRHQSRKAIKKAKNFTIMICGTSGTGRTTFINTLCKNTIFPNRASEGYANEYDSMMEVVSESSEIDFDGTRINLTVVDTPGFGNLIDNEPCFSKILAYLERQYDDVLAEESRIKRNPKFRDNRVHALLYFIEPTGHGLRQIDIQIMRRLSLRVNIIPLLARADTLTESEVKLNKMLVMEDIDHYGIPIYNFPYDIDSDDEETVEENAELRQLLPFAVVGAESVNSDELRRRFPWGEVQIRNPEHSDLTSLAAALFSSHLDDLKEITHDYLYENYRTEELSRMADPEESTENPTKHNMRLKEEQLKREEEKLREIELQVQKELNEKRAALKAKEEALRSLESRLGSVSVKDSDD